MSLCSFYTALIIGFEQNSYTVYESLNATGELVRIPVIKGNNQLSELRFLLTVIAISGSGPNAANINRLDTFHWDVLTHLHSDYTFSSDEQSIHFPFELYDDLEIEALEVFEIELSLVREESGLNIELGGTLADGRSLFASAQIFIVDNDGQLVCCM